MGLFWKTSERDRNEIVDRYRRGEPVKEIAKDFKLHRSYITKMAKRCGAPLRHRGRPNRLASGRGHG